MSIQFLVLLVGVLAAMLPWTTLAQMGSPTARAGVSLDQMAQMERQDFGVKPTRQIHDGPMHGPTPASIPGGQLITTQGLAALVKGAQVPFIVFDVLGQGNAAECCASRMAGTAGCVQ